MKTLSRIVFLSFFTLTTSVCAQQPPMTIISSWDFENVGAARRYIEKYQVPELDRMVEEGKILNWGICNTTWPMSMISSIGMSSTE